MTLSTNMKSALCSVAAGEQTSPYYSSIPYLVQRGLVAYVRESVHTPKAAVKKGESEYDTHEVVRYRLTPDGLDEFVKMRQATYKRLLGQLNKEHEMILTRARWLTVSAQGATPAR